MNKLSVRNEVNYELLLLLFGIFFYLERFSILILELEILLRKKKLPIAAVVFEEIRLLFLATRNLLSAKSTHTKNEFTYGALRDLVP